MGPPTGADVSQGTVIVTAPNGRPTLRVAYFFPRLKRKASIGALLRGLLHRVQVLHEIDILARGSEHDLIDEESQWKWINRIENGEFDVTIFTLHVDTGAVRTG